MFFLIWLLLSADLEWEIRWKLFLLKIRMWNSNFDESAWSMLPRITIKIPCIDCFWRNGSPDSLLLLQLHLNHFPPKFPEFFSFFFFVTQTWLPASVFWLFCVQHFVSLSSRGVLICLVSQVFVSSSVWNPQIVWSFSINFVCFLQLPFYPENNTVSIIRIFNLKCPKSKALNDFL